VHFYFRAELNPKIITGPDAAHWGLAARSLETNRLSEYPEFRPPLFPLLAVLASRLTGDLASGGMLVSTVLGSLLFLPFFIIARSMYGMPCAVLTASLILLDRKLLLISTQFCSDGTSAFMVGLALWAGWAALSMGGALRYFLLGAALALCYLTSLSNFILIPSFVVLLIVRLFTGKEKIRQKGLSVYLFIMGLTTLITLKLALLGGFDEALRQVSGGINAFAGSAGRGGVGAFFTPERLDNFSRNMAALIRGFPFPPRLLALFLAQGLAALAFTARPPLYIASRASFRELFLFLTLLPSLAFPLIITHDNFTFTERFMNPYVPLALLILARGALALAELPLGLLRFIPALGKPAGEIGGRILSPIVVIVMIALLAPPFANFFIGYGKTAEPYPFADDVLKAAAWLKANTPADAVVISRVPEITFHAERRYSNPVVDETYLENLQADTSQGSRTAYYLVLTDIPVGQKDTLEDYIRKSHPEEFLRRVWSSEPDRRYKISIYRIKGYGDAPGEKNSSP
jgi:hypothetical protein